MLDTDARRPALEIATYDIALLVNRLDALLATHDTDEPDTRWDGADDAIEVALTRLRDAGEAVVGALAFDPTT